MPHEVLATSATWEGKQPHFAVAVSTYNRSGFLEELTEALERQTMELDRFEVVLVDNGSSDDTATVLAEIAAKTRLRLVAARVDVNKGPSSGRNAAAALIRAPILAITDDDCLPAPGWLEALDEAFAAGADVVQGLTRPPDGVPRPAPWARTISIGRFSSLFETCNIAYRREAFEAAGGFDEHDPLVARAGGRAFGEDALLGWRVQGAGGRVAFAPDAVVNHRWLPGTYRVWLRERRQIADFAAFTHRSARFRDELFLGVFLNKRTFALDAAVASAIAAAITRRPVLLAGALPWAKERWADTRHRPGGSRLIRLAQLGVGDIVSLASLVQGSVRHRRVLL